MTDLTSNSHTIVIGAGPAGLAVGACLRHVGIKAILLERNDKVGSMWHRHYDRLHLHTDKKNSELPFLSYPKEYPRFISRAQLIDYLESYVQKFELDVRFHQQVRSADFKNDHWEVQTQDHSYQSLNLVVATGYNHEPFLPSWPGQDLFRGGIVHSSSYKNGEQFKGQKVLVVGFGNSGGEIAIDLWEHGAQPGLAVRSAVNVIPRELFGLPILAISILQSRLPPKLADVINTPILRMAIGDLTQYGLRKLPYGPATQIRKDARIPLIDVGTIKLIKTAQILLYKGIKEFTADDVVFVDGKQAPFDSVILATGYRPRVDTFLRGAPVIYNEYGAPLSSGRETSIPGLYFCGFYVSPTGMLREIAMEAKRISEAIAEKRSK